MPGIPSNQIRKANDTLETAAEDAIPAHGTTGEQIACGILRQITEFVRDNPDADLSDEDCEFLQWQIEACRRHLWPPRNY